MKLGFIGPAEGQVEALRAMVERLLQDVSVDRLVYLGIDHDIDDVLTAFSETILPGGSDEQRLFDLGASLAESGTAAEIDAFLAADEAIHRLRTVCKVPASPVRAIEMVDDRIVTVVYDKAALNEEDIANSAVCVYGKSHEPFVKKFGPRYFFTPGPVAHGKYGLVDLDAEGFVHLGLYEAAGTQVWREVLQGHRTSKMRVS